MTVTGELWFETAQVLPDAAVVRVWVIDATLAGAPGKVVAETTQSATNLSKPSYSIPFRLEVGRLDPVRAYLLCAHVDLDGSGTVKSGDWITTQSYPISAPGPDESVRIHMHQVRE